MSYLNPLRLHFAGRFQAAISTVNNDPLHYDNANFKPQYQQMQTGNSPDQWNGWFNPRGSANWRLIGCKVTAAWMADGSAADKNDPIGQYLIADSDRQVAAKLADLDPEQQLVSEIWGLEVRICDTNGATLLRGPYTPVGFMDIWDRAPSGGGDVGAGAMYQSTLSSLEWGDIDRSPFLKELRVAAHDDLLSIKFNVDGINMDFTSPDFLMGRITGTIGPATADEPQHFTLGRQFMTTSAPEPNFFAPAGKINFCVAVVDHTWGKIMLDLGNALPTVQPGDAPVDLGTLSLGYQAQDDNGVVVKPIGDIPYTDPGWYEETAGVIELPATRRLTDDELQALDSNPLVLQLPQAGGSPAVAIAEPPTGVYIRADQFVFRLNPGEEARVRLFATKFGHPYADARVVAILDPSQLQPGSPLGPAPAVGTPMQAIDFPCRLVTDAGGVATLPISAHDPGNPRGYIDGQVYGVRPVLEETVFYPDYPFNQWNFVSLLVWSAFEPDDPPTWYGCLQPIFQKYANLYPVMQQFLDLADYDSVCANRELLLLAFGLNERNPNSMPATHDLSAAKRQAILHWLNHVGRDGKPLQGSQPPAPRMAAVAVAPARVTLAPGAAKPPQGGKAAAASRRLALTRRMASR
jgi:hypothetical protein